MIPEDEVVLFVEKNMAVINSIKPSFFEMSVAMAFHYFAKSQVEVAVIEVGLGGRLDSTNIITPVLSVITNIGHDHMEMLGDTLDKIAFEKAGIIKNGVPVIIGEKHELTKNVFISAASGKSSDLWFAEDHYSCKLKEFDSDSGYRKFTLSKRDGNLRADGETLLGGDYQSKNIPVVAGAIDLLTKHFNITELNLMEGIKKTIVNTGLEGRWQILGKAPLIVCDTGHNKEGLEYVINQIINSPKKRLHLVIGFVNDKDLNQILPLLPKSAIYYFTKASVPRALDEKILISEASKYGLSGNSFDNVGSAFLKFIAAVLDIRVL